MKKVGESESGYKLRKAEVVLDIQEALKVEIEQLTPEQKLAEILQEFAEYDDTNNAVEVKIPAFPVDVIYDVPSSKPIANATQSKVNEIYEGVYDAPPNNQFIYDIPNNQPIYDVPRADV